MVKCDVCNKEGANAWYKRKLICQHCWIVYKYGDMESYMLRLEMKKKLKGGNKE